MAATNHAQETKPDRGFQVCGSHSGIRQSVVGCKLGDRAKDSSYRAGWLSSRQAGVKCLCSRIQTEGHGGMSWMRFLDLGAYLILAVVTGLHWQNDRHHWIGAAISVPAFILWMLARYQLGDSFSVRAEAKKLVTHGIYSKIRNPIYVFGGLAFVGEFVALGWYVWTAVLVIINCGQYFRIKREEQVLAEAFGDGYRAYKAQTWF